MRRGTFSLRLILLLSLAFLVAPRADASAQSASDESMIAEARADAAGIFQLAFDRKFNAMYDRIHPDAHAVVPRVAAVGAFEAAYGDTQAGQAEIVDSQIGTWTWPVTGQTYEDTVQISFRQPFVDEDGKEAVLEDEMYLVESDGDWRWFFGNSRETVDDAIEAYGGEVEERGAPLTQGDLLTNVVNDLDAFYRDALSYTDYEYDTPGVVVVAEGDSVQSACGPAETGFWGFFCPPDSTIYLDEPLLLQLEQQGADFAAAFVIAHEWAHHVQTEVNIERTTSPNAWNEVYSIELELMADCMAGAWAQDVDTRGLLDAGDIDEAAQLAVERLGDPQYIDEYDPQAHGTGEQRVTSLMNGYNDGFSGCNVVL